MDAQEKPVNVLFFITGQESKKTNIITPTVFESLWADHFSQNKGSLQQEKAIETATNVVHKKNLVLDIKEGTNGVYFGYIGVFRDSVLPTVYNTKTNDDKPIPLTPADEVLEKSYFVYDASRDLLAFHRNHLGPTANDLSFMLFSLSGLELIYFDPIWKDANIKAILNTGTILKRAEITVALPRKFDIPLNLNNPWAKEVMQMMSSTGMSRLALQCNGRASTTKSAMGYLSHDIKDGIKELLSFGPKIVKKATAQEAGGSKENLLEQELKAQVKVEVINGYPKEIDMKKALMAAREKCKDELAKY